MQHRITSSICLQINSHAPCSKDMINSINGITRFPLSSWTIHVEQSTTGCLWPAKQDRRQPFNTREVSTSRQNTIHHQASQNHLGTDMSDTVRINYINNISQLLYIDMYVFKKKNTILHTECIRCHLTDRRPTAFNAKKWRAILGSWTAPTSFHPNLWLFSVHLIIAVHNHPSNIKPLFFWWERRVCTIRLKDTKGFRWGTAPKRKTIMKFFMPIWKNGSASTSEVPKSETEIGGLSNPIGDPEEAWKDMTWEDQG